MVKKLKELSNTDLDNYFRNDRNYGGTFSKDKLPKSIAKKFYVVNMQNENDGQGSHWTLLDNATGKVVNYFDSVSIKI